MNPADEDWTGVAIGLLYHLQKASQDSTYQVPRLACLLLLQHGQEERAPSPSLRRRPGDQGAAAPSRSASLLSQVEGWEEASESLRSLLERRGDLLQARQQVEIFLGRALQWSTPSIASASLPL